ncbi:hypothetical protein [Streptomyces sp. NBC_00620]|uniref:hypothetical protein n=1 Tax=Streptomyces sp. NBC_00620 TaxID=2903666 RepID=UPI00225ACD37|nr:hypothetical protein [Streptomyces sp. NBC_00620]MCX4974512.1 hypothetical protein [Streptomyces sp. NBC_00620]
MTTNTAELMARFAPYLAAAVGVYGERALEQVGDVSVDAMSNAGRKMLVTAWRRQGLEGRRALELAVRDAADEPDDADAASALRQQMKRILREDPELSRELTSLLADAGGNVTVTVSGERSIAARNIGVAITGDNVTIRP